MLPKNTHTYPHHPEPGLDGGNSNDPEHFPRDYVQALREEARRYRQRAQEAEQRLQQQEGEAAAATEEFRQRLIHSELRSAAQRAGIIDLDGLRLADTSSLVCADDGSVQGVDTLIDTLKSARPWLFNTAAQANAPAGNTASTAQAPAPRTPEQRRATDMSEAEYRQEKARLLGQGRGPR